MFPLLPHDKHESLCRRCGMSCHSPILLGTRTVIISELRCRFLAYDSEAKALCMVYENRYEAAPWCKLAEEAFTMNGLAHDCPYTAGIDSYRGKHWATPKEHRAIVPVLTFPRQAFVSVLIFAAVWEVLSHLAPVLGIPPFAIPSP